MSAAAPSAAPADHAERRRYTICVDFDGVLHSYTSPWVAPDVIPDPPVPGAVEWLNEIQADYTVVVFTTRGETPEGRAAVLEYLALHGADVDEVTVTAGPKPPALLYIDDRAWRFHGRFPSAKTIRYARPWKVGDAEHVGAKEKLRAAGERQNQLQGKLGRMRAQLGATRRELLLEVLTGRGFTDAAAVEWADAHADQPFERRLEQARAEAVR